MANTESADTRAVVTNELGFKLLARLLDADARHNVFICPTGISIALSVLLNGANGDTRAALAGLLGHGDSLEDFNHANHKLLSKIEQKTSGAETSLAHGLWTNKERSLDPSFSKTVERFYQAQTGSLDLNSAAGVEAINSWVREQTHRQISSVIEANDLQPPVSCVIISALHFVGTWANPFSPTATREGPFYGSGKRTKSVPLMRQTDTYPYYQDKTFQIIKLPYGESGFSAYFLLPSAGVSLGKFLIALDAKEWNRSVELLREQQVELTLPRFELTYETDLNETLSKLGLRLVFSSAADFGPMGLPGEFITKFKHKAVATVDEKGTTAAAVSAIMMGRSLFTPPQMLINRPFLWVVRHDASGALLFVAAVFDPSS